MAVVSSEDHDVFASGMTAEDGPHGFGEENWSRPAVRDANGLQSGMQLVDTAFEPEETLRGFSFADIKAVQVWRNELL